MIGDFRTIKAKVVAKSAAGGKKSGKKTEDRILDLLAWNPKMTFAGMVAAHGISRSAIQKHVEHLKDAQCLHRVDPDKGGRRKVTSLAEDTEKWRLTRTTQFIRRGFHDDKYVR